MHLNRAREVPSINGRKSLRTRRLACIRQSRRERRPVISLQHRPATVPGMDTRSVGVGGLFSRIDMLEHAWCVRLNRGCSLPSARTLFAVVSRLGDGVFWYAVMLILP